MFVCFFISTAILLGVLIAVNNNNNKKKKKKKKNNIIRNIAAKILVNAFYHKTFDAG